MTITNASAEMISSYVNIAVNYDVKPVPVRQQNYKQQRFTDAENEKIGDIFDEDFDDEDMDKTIH